MQMWIPKQNVLSKINGFSDINKSHPLILVPYIQRIDHKKYLFSNPLTHGNFPTLHIVMYVHNTCSYEQNKLPQVQPVFLRPELLTASCFLVNFQ